MMCRTHRESPARSKHQADNLRDIRCPLLDCLTFQLTQESLERTSRPLLGKQDTLYKGTAPVSGNNKKDRMKMRLVTSASFCLDITWRFQSTSSKFIFRNGTKMSSCFCCA